MSKKSVKLWLVFSIFWMGIFSEFAHSEDKPAFSGFLGDYGDFAESTRVKGAWVYFKPGMNIADLKQYNKVILEPVQLYGGSGDVFKDVDKEQLEKAAQMLHQKIADALGSDYPLVSEPGTDVLRIRAALTGAAPRDRKYGAASYIPVALLFRAAKAGADAATDKEEIQVEATMEAEFIDSTSNERIMAAVDSHRGEAVTVDEKNPDIEANTMDDAFEFWAKTIKMRLDEAHGKGPDVQVGE
jgi:hypothetical protein